jgi:thiol-disulfide isomerase/thioredoxin
MLVIQCFWNPPWWLMSCSRKALRAKGKRLYQFHGAFLERLVAKTELEIAKFESFDFDFQLTDVDGNSVSKDDFQGKVLIADIWGTWCPPCREEIPLFIQLKDQYADQLEIVGINYERADDPDKATAMIKQFMSKHSMNYNCVIGDDKTRKQVPNFQGFPSTLFIDGTGKVRLVLVGLHPFAKLESVVKALTNETSSN